MKILELIGHALRPIHSDDSKLTESGAEIAAQSHAISVMSPIFAHNARIPVDYTVDGQSKFPSIDWTNLPNICRSLLLVVEDPDAPKPTPFVHGIIYNIPTDLPGLPEDAFLSEGISSKYSNMGVKMGKNTVGKSAYMAPAPPPGNGPHHYHFQLIALDKMLEFQDPPTLKDVKAALADHVVGSGELVGIYEK